MSRLAWNGRGYGGRSRRRWGATLGLAWLAALLSGCGSAPPPPPPEPIVMAADVDVAAGLNPDASGRPSPLLVAVYQLKSEEGFLNKDFFSVFDPAGAALAADLVAREQITLQPGGSREFQAPFAADTKFIGVVGAFSDLERAEWCAVVAVPDANVLRQTRVRISVLDRAVAISIGEG